MSRRKNNYTRKACVIGSFGTYEYQSGTMSKNLMPGMGAKQTGLVMAPVVDRAPTMVDDGSQRVDQNVISKDVYKYVEPTLRPEFPKPAYPEMPKVPEPAPEPESPDQDDAPSEPEPSPDTPAEAKKAFPWMKVLLIAAGVFLLIKLLDNKTIINNA